MVNSRLFIIDHSALLFVGGKTSEGRHEHHFLQLAFALNGSFCMDTEEGPRAVKAFALDADAEHQLREASGNLLLILINPESLTGRRLRSSLLGRRPQRILDHEPFRDILKAVASDPPRTLDQARAVLHNVLSVFNVSPQGERLMDGRIKKMLDFIDRLPEKKIGVGELARVACLSESRLHHLFKSEIGIPIRRYLLWKRLEDGLGKVLGNADFTVASLDSGFADSAHMSKTFKTMFGCTLSDIFKDGRFIQVIFR